MGWKASGYVRRKKKKGSWFNPVRNRPFIYSRIFYFQNVSNILIAFDRNVTASKQFNASIPLSLSAKNF